MSKEIPNRQKKRITPPTPGADAGQARQFPEAERRQAAQAPPCGLTHPL